MSFGVSGSDAHSQMVGGDVAVAWVEQRTLKGHAVDYYLDAKSQCAGVRGSCPDERLGEKTESLRLLNAALVNGYSIVTYQRSVRAADQLDRPLLTNGSQPVIWAIGPLNDKQEVSYHTHFLKSDKFIEFGRPPVWNCPMPEAEEGTTAASPSATEAARPQAAPQADKQSVIQSRPPPPPAAALAVVPWDIPPIQCDEPDDGVFYVQMGPTGGKHGYPAITGHVGWGISWYMNGLLIPEIHVVRGRRYTFVTEGGEDPAVPARYHPFYITNDPVGGYFHKSDDEKKGVEIYAGVKRARDGSLQPTGVGRLCMWTPDSDANADDFPSFGAYQRVLTLICDQGNPGLVTWTPDRDTPDTVYYQLPKPSLYRMSASLTGTSGGRYTCTTTAPPTATGPPASRMRPCCPRRGAKPSHSNANRASDEPLSGDQLRQLIEAAEDLELHAREEFVQDGRLRGPAAPDRPAGEGEYPTSPARPLTLQAVMRPGPSHLYRRPAPPRRPPHPPHHRGPPPHMLPPGPPRYGPPLASSSSGKGHGGPNGQGYSGPNGQGHSGPNGQGHSGPNGQGHNGPNGQGHTGSNGQGQYRPGHSGPNGASQYPHSNGQNGPMSDQQGSASHYGPASAVYPGPPSGPLPSAGHGLSNGHGSTLAQNAQSSGQKGPLSTPHGSPNGPHGPSNGQHGPTSGQNSQSSNLGQSFNQYGSQPGKKYNKPPPGRAPRPPVKPQYPSKPPQKSSGHMQAIIMGKPAVPPHSQTLSLGKTDIIANQVVKSQITLPGFNEPVAQHSTPQNFFSKPGAGQIILGKPLEHPAPLDQQMAPSAPHPARLPPAPVTPPLAIRVEGEDDMVKSSDFIGESTTTDVSTSAPAINTGFKPDSIVIESGFKPIIREPLMAGEDRIADFDNGNANRREDTDVVEDYEESPQYITNQHVFSSEKMTESFEPMFIPSPEDNMSPSIDILLPTEDRTKEVFPSNHAKEDRPHPVYVKTDTESKEVFKDVGITDILGQASRVSPQYLPPDNKPKQSQKIINDEYLTSYDGKLVSATSLTSIPVPQQSSTKLYSAKRPTNAELLLRTPQFGTFKGESPPSIAELERHGESLPIAIDMDPRITKLKLVNALREEDSEEKDELKAEASEVSEVTEEKKVTGEKKDDIKDSEEKEETEDEDDEEYEEEEDDEDNDTKRRKRETKDTQFEAGAAAETMVAPSNENTVKNQVEFNQPSVLRGSSSAKYISVPSLLIIMILRFL